MSPSLLLLPFLLCSFCPKFFSSSPHVSVSHHASSTTALPHLPPPVSLCQYISFPFMSFTPPLSFYCLSSCHFAVPSLFSTSLSFSPYLCISVNLPLFLYFSLCCSICLPLSLLAANTCDEEMLLCQNGGTCYQNQKCICPPEFKGVLCQQSRCEAGKDCNTASSLHLSMATLLLCTLLAHMLATLNPH